MEKNRVLAQSFKQLIWCRGNRSLCFGIRVKVNWNCRNMDNDGLWSPRLLYKTICGKVLKTFAEWKRICARVVLVSELFDAQNNSCHIIALHCVSRKSSHFKTLCNFVKSKPIFKTFALLESLWHLLQNAHNTTHLTLGMLLHYLGISKIQFFCKYSTDMEKIQTNCTFSASILIHLRV